MKPKIICHMIGSVDGRLQLQRYSPIFEDVSQDSLVGIYVEESNRLKADAWMIGRKSVQELAFPETFDHGRYPPTQNPVAFLAKRSSERASVVFDPSGKIRYADNKIMGDDIVAVLGEGVSEEYLGFLREKEISYTFAGPDGKNLRQAMASLHGDFGMKLVLLEGGGILNGTFLKAGLIDELLLLVFPAIDGLAGASSIFDYPGEPDELPGQKQALELLSVSQRKHGAVYLSYRFHPVS